MQLSDFIKQAENKQRELRQEVATSSFKNDSRTISFAGVKLHPDMNYSNMNNNEIVLAHTIVHTAYANKISNFGNLKSIHDNVSSDIKTASTPKVETQVIAPDTQILTGTKVEDAKAQEAKTLETTVQEAKTDSVVSIPAYQKPAYTLPSVIATPQELFKDYTKLAPTTLKVEVPKESNTTPAALQEDKIQKQENVPVQTVNLQNAVEKPTNANLAILTEPSLNPSLNLSVGARYDSLLRQTQPQIGVGYTFANPKLGVKEIELFGFRNNNRSQITAPNDVHTTTASPYTITANLGSKYREQAEGVGLFFGIQATPKLTIGPTVGYISNKYTSNAQIVNKTFDTGVLTSQDQYKFDFENTMKGYFVGARLNYKFDLLKQNERIKVGLMSELGIEHFNTQKFNLILTPSNFQTPIINNTLPYKQNGMYGTVGISIKFGNKK